MTMKTMTTTRSWRRLLKRLLAIASRQSWSDALERSVDKAIAPWIRFQLHQPYPPPRVEETVGAYGERLTCEYLARKNFFVLERSFRANGGEIDIIAAWKKRVVVFVEVKTWIRPSLNNGGPSDRVDEKKKENISKTALRYMKQHHLLGCSGRMDVIEVILEPTEELCPMHTSSYMGASQPMFRHFENAFEAVGRFQMFS